MSQLSFAFGDSISIQDYKKLKILSCGAGMQSTALALKSCENKIAFMKGLPLPHPTIPIYDYIIFCDLDKEPEHVYKQVNFIEKACNEVGIPFVVLSKNDGYGKSLYQNYMDDFGHKSVRSIPFWTLDEIVDPVTGEITYKKGKMPRVCTMDYKINVIQKYIRFEIMKYNLYQRVKPEDIKAHEMHIGFSFEEKQRCKENPHPMFVNVFPLVDLQLERKDNYAYCLDVWGLETKASACLICPFHTNHFFNELKTNNPKEYADVIQFDSMLMARQPMSKIKSKLFISKSRKRIVDLEPHDCNDQEFFEYKGQLVGNGF